MKVPHTDFELQGRVKTSEIMVLEGAVGYALPECSVGDVLGFVSQVTFTHEQTILILDLVPYHGDLKSIFPHSGTLYLVSANEPS